MRTDIDTRINEAEVCRSMGLFAESLAIYEKILPLVPAHQPEVQQTIRDRMQLLRQEIDKEEAASLPGVSARDISFIRGAISAAGDVNAIMDSATAFQEMGLHSEAVVEFAKLFGETYPLEKLMPLLAESLLKVHPPSSAVGELIGLIPGEGFDKVKAARIRYLLGLEMEKRDHRDQAHDLYKSAHEINPADAEIKKQLASVAASFAAGSRYDYLLRERLVTTDQLQKAFGTSKKINKSVEHVLIEQHKIRKEAIAKSFSLFYGCRFRSFDPNLPAPVELLANLKMAFLLNELWIPISWSKEGIEVLVDDPRNLNKTDNIKALMKTGKINFSVATREDIQQFIRHFFDKERAGEQAPAEEQMPDLDIIDVTFEEEKEDVVVDDADESSSQVVKLVDQIIIAAYRKNASDIHIEPSVVSKSTSIRFRLDGVCQEYMKVPNSMVRGIVSRIKIMSNLDIAERRLPQDGKIKFRRKGVPGFEMRVATLPTAGGFEDVVMRILASAGAMKIDEMGLTPRNLEVIKRIVVNPYGLILAVGPTGSGKTTTLHGLLGHINKPGVKIWTAEDPIEITQQGLRQVEVKPKIGLDFARVMRAFLRADPDIIMIGEMRDEETASIGIEASLTGHLVFSTLHTNSAPETVTRLLDMGLNALNFSDAFLGVLAQRLTRRLCENCRKPNVLGRDEFEELQNDYGRQWFPATGIEYAENLAIYRPVGCESCSGTGYRGRMGIHELMEGTPDIKLMIKKQANTEEIFNAAMQQGMSTLKQDGIMKVFKGITDISEVRRVCIM
ncbi:MAG: Flp pilus assembly complex ATPase component TadA [Desulfobacterales bacterium]|jgi:type II secretory ATPase GspE/PulE/Tfp pilus assembly ATPase PilB-like protein|nr:Flp pilus assembly complex ATPase component TadA [Desulfobacterales bacterium]